MLEKIIALFQGTIGRITLKAAEAAFLEAKDAVSGSIAAQPGLDRRQRDLAQQGADLAFEVIRDRFQARFTK